jgi:UrcA family protein
MTFEATTRTARILRNTAIGAAATLIASVALAPSLWAAPSDDVPSVIVKYDASKAATPDGALSLYAQLQYAARQVCPSDRAGDLMYAGTVRQCRKQALDRAVSQIHERHLVEIAAARSARG